MIIIFTGNGKGKTTAALGQAMRMVGRGKRVLMIQWIKGPWRTGEEFVDLIAKGSSSTGSETKLSAEQKSLPAGRQGSGTFKLVKKGLGFVGILGDKLPRAEHQKAAEDAWKYFLNELKTGEWDAIILDELNVALSLKLLSIKEVLAGLKKVPLEKYIIVTGRAAPRALISAADLVTEMREIKHPFNKGKLAKIALEF